MLERARESFFVAGRASADLLLRAVGVLDVRPLWSGTGRPRKTIAFQAFSAHIAQCYEPVVARLRSTHPEIRLQFLILLHPHQPFAATGELRRYVRERLLIADEDVFFFWRQIWGSFDLLVCGDTFARFPARPTKTVLLPHGTALLQRMIEPHPLRLRKSLLDFDRTLLAGTYDLDAIRHHPSTHGIAARAVSVGFPFLDQLARPRLSREQYCGRLGLDPDRQTVLFAPHWTALQASDARSYGDEVVTALKKLDVNVVVKLHVCSFYPAMARGVRWRPLLEKLARDPRVHVDDETDDTMALLHADVLVTDFSSRAFVFMALDKPVILGAPAHADPVGEEDERMNLMRSGSFVASSAADVADLVARRLGDRTPHPASAEVAARCFSNFQQATGPVADLLAREVSSEWRQS